MSWINDSTSDLDNKWLVSTEEGQELSEQGQELTEEVKSDITKILIKDRKIIRVIIESILDKLNITNGITEVILLSTLERYINENTNFIYNGDSNEIIWISLNESQISLLEDDINKILIREYNEKSKSKLWKRKSERVFYLKTIQKKKQELEKTIQESENELNIIQKYTTIIQNDRVTWLILAETIIINEMQVKKTNMIEINETIRSNKQIIDEIDEQIKKLNNNTEVPKVFTEDMLFLSLNYNNL